MTVSLEHRPALALGTRLQFDDVRNQQMLLVPEGVVNLNESALEVLQLCDGKRTVGEIIATLSDRYGGADLGDDVRELIGGIAEKGLIFLGA